MKRKITCLSLLLLTAIFFHLACKERQGSATSPEETMPKGLCIAAQNGLFDLRHDFTNQRFEKRNEVTLSDLTDMAMCGSSCFVSTHEIIRKYDATFNEGQSKTFGKIGAVGSHGNHLFVAADGSFICLNEDLQELDRIKLEFEGPVPPDKNAHDIQIYRDTAYLLDNIVGPLFLFRINIQKPRDLHVTERIMFQDINSHLHGQWLNPALGQWMVIQSFAHKGGAGKNVHIYPMDGGKESIGTTQIYSHRVVPQQDKEGYDLKGVTDVPPVWAVVQDINDKYSVARVSSENNQISFSSFLQVDLSGRHQEIIVQRKGTYLYIIPKFGNRLHVVDITEEPKILFSEDLQELGIQAVVDVLAY
jgi:hypothetical protein